MYWQMLSPVITYPSSSPRSRQWCHAAPLCPLTLHTADTQSARLDLSSLDSAVQQFFSAGLANSTKRSYQSGANRYIRFCSLFGVTPYPATERSLSHFVGYLLQEGLSASTVKGYLSAVRHAQISLGLGDPRMGDMSQLEYHIKGLRKLSSGRQQSRLPITINILRYLRSSWEKSPGHFDGTMLWAACCMCFFGFLRSGEIVVPADSAYDRAVHLSGGDVRVDNTTDPQYFEVHIKASKTDPFRHGVSIYLGHSQADLCLVSAVLAYMVFRGPSPGPFFFVDRRYLTRDHFVSSVRAALRMQGVDDSRYSGHSFHIRAATTAALRGLPDSLIKTLGCWESSAYTVYIRTPRETLCSVSRSLVAV